MNGSQTQDHHLSSGIDAELQVEVDGINAGVEAYRRSTLKLEQKGMESLTDYGSRLLSHWIRPLTEQFEQFLVDAKSKPGRKHLAVQYLELIDLDVAALITCRAMIDGISETKPVQQCAIEIGGRIEDEFRFTQFEKKEKRLFKKVEQNLDNHPIGYQARVRQSMMSHTMKKFNVVVEKWGRTEKMHLGMKLIEITVENLGLFQLQHAGKFKQTKITIVGTPTMHEWIANYTSRCEMFYPQRMPMVCPPKAWTTASDGGYHHSRLRNRLVKTRTKGLAQEYETHEMPQVYSAVNALQSTAWKINMPVLEAFNRCWRNRLECEGIPPMYNEELPPKPHDHVTNTEARAAWKAKAAEIWRANNKAEAKRIQVVQIRSIAERFAQYPAIWFPVQLDFRGRIYSLPQGLNPQGCDLAKGLLTFAEGKPLGEAGAWWLAIHLANCFGYDKVDMAARVAWAEEHSDQIIRCAETPEDEWFWTEADKPIQFLAACIEWAGFKKHGYEYVSSLPILVDGSCNGIQHFAAMLRDETAGKHVNLLPADKPADIYAAVAEALTAALRAYASDTGTIAGTKDQIEKEKERRLWAQQWADYGITRKITKRPVMVLPYGGTLAAVREYLGEAVKDAASKGKPHPFDKRLGYATAFLAEMCWSVMGQLIVGPRLAMDWLREAAKVITKTEPKFPITWTTPTGFIVQQSYLDTKSRRVKTKVGDATVYLSISEEQKTLDKRRQVTAIAPNFVHSLDAAALMSCINLATLNDINAFSAIHDSYGTHAADMEKLQQCLRHSFVLMYEENDVLKQFADQVAVEGSPLPELPAKGSLDVRQVLESNFFFA